MNLADKLVRTAQSHPDRAAVRLDDYQLSYRALADGAARVAGWLRSLGVQPGERVGLTLPNLPQFPVIYYGILWAGAVVVPMNPLFKSREIAFALRDSEARVLFAWDGVADEAGKGASEAGVSFISVSPVTFGAQLAEHQPIELTDREAQSTAVVLYTSGTTGTPKGAELTHANMSTNTETTARMLGATADDMIFGGLPLFHSFGQTVGMNVAVAVGATLTLVPRFEPGKVFEVLQRDKVTIMEGVPTMYVALLQSTDRGGVDTSALRLCVSGGASLPVEVLRGFEQAFGCILLEGYGLSETSPVASFNHADRERKAGSIGQPIEDVEFRLVDEEWNAVPEGEIGEIAIKGPNVMKGYLNRPDDTALVMRDGWFRTGDLARRDDEGYYFIVDRAKDMIIRGGYNVYPREIEEVLYEHPAVAEAAVIGVPHPTHGEEVAAVITVKPGASVTEDEIREFTKARVAPYKYPRIVWITDALPKGSTGKLLKREITLPADAAPAPRNDG
jgi:long-chain acyl-CoA synthetase